jgi:hypothetical protein
MMVMCARPAASQRPGAVAAARGTVDEPRSNRNPAADVKVVDFTGRCAVGLPQAAVPRRAHHIPGTRSRARRSMDYPGGMKPSLTQSQLVKELAGTAAKLDSPKLTGEKRMALLRRQAQLGDLRDMMAERARRAEK